MAPNNEMDEKCITCELSQPSAARETAATAAACSPCATSWPLASRTRDHLQITSLRPLARLAQRNKAQGFGEVCTRPTMALPGRSS